MSYHRKPNTNNITSSLRKKKAQKKPKLHIMQIKVIGNLVFSKKKKILIWKLILNYLCDLIMDLIQKM